jgi:general secretion pathway protein E
MPVFVLKPNGWQGRHVELGDGAVSIGRHPDNTIRIKDDRASRFHCVIEPDGRGRFVIRDLGSANGTKINEVKVEQAFLEAGDVLRVAGHEFLVIEDEQLEPAEAVPQRRRRGKPDNGHAASAAATERWARELRTMIDELLPKGQIEEDLVLLNADGQDSGALKGDGPGPRVVRLLHQLASKCRATDIHAEPRRETFQIRMRVDGQMVPIIELPLDAGNLLCGLVRTACQLKTAGRDAVQDGHYSLRFPDRRVEMRASFTPSVHGQKLVLRVLDQRGLPHSIDELGLAPYMLQRLRRVTEQSQGLLLVCGPTGSGKTTTLYTALREIDREAKNVVTIEDPVEYTLEGVTQIPIDEHRGNTFGSLLRSVLRQDPDVILVGEIRDEETARTAMQAAMTGHLVYTTVHSKDTISSVFRLLDLGVEPYLVANSLDLVLAQRLVRVLCEHCRRRVPVAPGQATRMGRFLGGKAHVNSATGCSKCLRTGYRGRRAIFELLDVNDELRDVVLREPSIQAMKRVIEQGMFTTLVQSGWRLAAEGVTSLEEVDNVAGLG